LKQAQESGYKNLQHHGCPKWPEYAESLQGDPFSAWHVVFQSYGMQMDFTYLDAVQRFGLLEAMRDQEHASYNPSFFFPHAFVASFKHTQQ
jgi:hypothetical protein